MAYTANSKHLFSLLIFCIAAIYSLSATAYTTPPSKEIVYLIPKSEIDSVDHDDYVKALLKSALNHSKAPNEAISLVEINKRLTQARLISELKSKAAIDIIWSMTSHEREESMLPIRIPLYKGLLGHRVFLIRAGQQEKFSKINTLNELRKLMAGQGSHWPDTRILRANKLKVMTNVHYEPLFQMLQAERFDYFPRAVNEAWLELESDLSEGLAIEQHLMLNYPAPLYFFVHKDNIDLANRIERGLEAMIDDGSFELHFNSNPNLQGFFLDQKLNSRKVLTLVNPILPKETPLDISKYWY